MSNTTITPTVGAITMAGVASALAYAAPYASPLLGVPARDSNGLTVIWNLTDVNFPIGNAILFPGTWNAASFAVTGTFGSAGSVQMEGSNDGTNFYKLSPAAVTSAGLVAALAVNERPKYIRPHVTAGDSTTALTITAYFSTDT